MAPHNLRDVTSTLTPVADVENLPGILLSSKRAPARRHCQMQKVLRPADDAGYAPALISI